MLVIGIDPGKSGGIASVDDRSNILSLSTMPLSGKEICPKSIAHLLHQMTYGEDLVMVYIEHCQAMPKQGVTSMFNYGVGFGMLQGICAAMSYPYCLVKPREWQKMMHKGADQGADPKDRSAQVIYRMYPKQNLRASVRCKKDHDGMIDAILIASFGMRIVLGQLEQDSR